VTLGANSNTIKHGKHLAILPYFSIHLTFNPKIYKDHIFPWVVHMCDIVTLSEKDKTL
jgi:hypothetical protein